MQSILKRVYYQGSTLSAYHAKHIRIPTALRPMTSFATPEIFRSNVLDGSKINPASQEFKDSQASMQSLTSELRSRMETVRQGGGVKSRDRHESRGKLFARDRIDSLLDPASPFLEIAPLAGYKLYEKENLDVPSGGIIAGIGTISGIRCMVLANDAVRNLVRIWENHPHNLAYISISPQTVKGGTYFPITVKKHLRAQEIARENSLPCIYLVDSGGAFLPKQDEIFPDKEYVPKLRSK